MDEYFRQLILDKNEEGLSVNEIAEQVPYSIRDVASTILFQMNQSLITSQQFLDAKRNAEMIVAEAEREFKELENQLEERLLSDHQNG